MQENYIPNNREKMLWWLSTAETELVKNAVVDRNRHAIIGMLMLSTWCFATLAWTYFFSTVVPELWKAALLGIFMGGIILCIDRALIKGIGIITRKIWLTLAFRALLAVTIGLFMAQPALLFLFQKEVKMQASLDNETRKNEKQKAIELRLKTERERLIKQRQEIRSELTVLYRDMTANQTAFIQETDGTGGSGKLGLKAIAMAKKERAEKAEKAYQIAVDRLSPVQEQIDSSLQAIEQKKQYELLRFDSLLNNGFITQIEALNHLIENNTAVAYRYYLLVALLLLIELMPVIAKLLLPTGTYQVYAKKIEEQEIAAIQST
ncbi:DUF4407 domain-containing protein [Sediminibacterium sp. TEGAF015]|uniref:DUF4407 domain-containing protein n=1 Tax=Sediminibacterium sp. TEGAF015 TaxID=575378 RepID=UPI0021FA6ADA|nr:DUF4407 domain-containing protein [Sediminibacterium sp. TEGAF015]BDQ10846.1 hypothetical protein TEGAF0_00630 [Sediminibacterium sp. TEGAF015]